MAKKNAKTDEAAAEEAPARSKKKLFIVVAALLLVSGGGGGFFFMKKSAHAEHGAEHGEAGHEAKKPVAFLDVRDLIVNLAAEPGKPKSSLLRLRVALELKDAKVEGEVKPLLPRVEDAFQVYMRELRPTDLAGSAGLYRLREELLRRVNIALYPAKAEAVLFKDVVIQEQ